jgi:hypothetical protein
VSAAEGGTTDRWYIEIILDTHFKLSSLSRVSSYQFLGQAPRTKRHQPQPHQLRSLQHNTGRGLFPHRHYAAWGDFAKDVYHSKEYRDDFPHSQNWLDANRALWDYLSNLLRLVRPEMWKTANNFKFLKEKHLAGAWSGMAINQDTKDGGDVHQDWQDSQRVFNCVVPFGIFSGADLVLWQAGLRFQLSRGEVLFFFGSLLAHHVTKVTSGRRSVVDLFTHKSNFDVRKRKFKATENRETYRKWGLEKKARAST